MKRLYQERRLLRGIEGLSARAEGLLSRLTASSLNPLYHLGTLSIFLLIVLTVTGVYLTLFYRPGADRAYATVTQIDASWLGSLMRTVHRYAADGLIVTVLLHALKMFLGDRFWGSRWLSWISGWALLALIWLIGVMGYWLVWDQRAQWLTDYGTGLIKGPVALTFLTPGGLAETFTFFVIVLFLHVFLSVIIVLGLLFHLMRLARPRLWSPRWLMVEAGIALAIMAVWRPATSAAPADPGRLVGALTLDGWYLGFLPLAAGTGTGLLWGAVALLCMALLALPWLARGRSQGPAVVADELCTGCALCSQECPYGAIEMRALPGDARYPSLAVVNPNLCTGCGLCVGTCSTSGIDLAGLRTAPMREQIKRSLAEARACGQSPVVVFACQRHAALGTLAAVKSAETGERNGQESGGRVGQDLCTHGSGYEPIALATSLSGASAGSSQVMPGFWGGANGHPGLSVLACSLPCVGMVQPEMIRDSLGAGAQAVVILSAPADDCGFREGPHWLAGRLGRRKSLLRQEVYMLEVAPGEQEPLAGLLGSLAHDRTDQPYVGIQAIGRWRLGVSLATGLATLILALGLSLAVNFPVTAAPPEQSMIRVALAHTAQLKAPSAGMSDEMRAKLPPGVSAEQIVGGERFPVRIRLEIDGAMVAEREYRPGGLRQEGTAYGLESWPLPPGRHHARLWMMDDGTNWREAFAGPINMEAGRVFALTYDPAQAAFVAR